MVPRSIGHLWGRAWLNASEDHSSEEEEGEIIYAMISSAAYYAPQVRGRFLVPKTTKLLIGSSGTSDMCHAPGRRSSMALRAILASIRARGAPRQKWIPRPKPRCRFG